MISNQTHSLLNLTQLLLSPFQEEPQQSDNTYLSLKSIFITTLKQSEDTSLQSEINAFQIKSNFQKQSTLTQIISTIVNSKSNSISTTLIATNKQKITDYIIYFINFIHEVYKSKYNKTNTFNQACYSNLTDSYKSLFDIFSSSVSDDNTNCNYTFIFKFFFNHLIFISENTHPQTLESIGKILMDFFSRFQSIDNKELMFFCALNLIKAYFKLKTYRNAKTFFGWIERSEVVLNRLDVMSQISFYFYYGKLMLFEMQIDESRKYFLLGHSLFTNSINKIDWNESVSILNKSLMSYNKKTILEYILILSLFSGKVLSSSFLIKYNLIEYSNFLYAFQTGDLLLFNEETEKLKVKFVELGLFLVVVKLKAYVLRSFIYEVYSLNKEEMEKMKFPIIRIEDIYSIYNQYRVYKHEDNMKKGVYNIYDNEITSQEEMEFAVLSVIHKGLIKGYVHYNKKEIVFSKKNPFPRFEDVFNENRYKII